MRRIALSIVAALLALTGTAAAKQPKRSASKGAAVACSGAKSKCRRIATFSGRNAPAAELRRAPLTRPSGDVWVRAINLATEIRVNIYRPDGSYNEQALAELDEVFRCARTGEVRAMNPKLYEHLSRIGDRYSGRPIEVISGFRFAERESSRHFHASAMDIRVRGVSPHELRRFAETLDQGKDSPDGALGIGIYPTSGFVHVDFRAPGEPSYRWLDRSGPGKPTKARGKRPRTQPARKPTS
jgi:uncharacterized protein YcbK (DUF882 family)